MFFCFIFFIYKKAIRPLAKRKKKKRNQVTVLALQSPRAQDFFLLGQVCEPRLFSTNDLPFSIVLFKVFFY